MSNRCLVIGGGIIGLLTARQLREDGYEVVVIERGRVGRESSWAAGGILAPMYPWKYPEPVTDLFLWSAKRFPHLSNELAEESGVDPEWVQSGMLIFDAEEKQGALEWAWRNEIGLDIISGDVVAGVEPYLAPIATEALWLQEIAQIRPPRLVKALRKSLEKRGVNIIEGAEVQSILVEKDRATGVKTHQLQFSADVVVLAGGAWSSEILAPLGFHADVIPVRGQMLLYKAKPGWLSRMVFHKQRYLIPRRDGRILAGSTVEYVGFKKRTSREGIESLKKSALEMMPRLDECLLESRWAGLRPGKSDNLPIIGPHPSIQGLFINAGHFRSGVVLSPASAQICANLIGNQPPILDPTAYLPQ